MLRFAFLLFLPAIASAQSLCQTNSAVLARHSSNTWSAPFDRTVTLRAREISLREALDRVAAAAGLRFSYSSESLSLDRRVCVFFEDKHVGDALAELLQGTSVQAVSAGGDQVVLVAAEREALPEIIPLEKIVVTGSTTGIPRRSLTVAVDVIQGKDLEHRNATSISDILRASVPGMWPWQQSPSNLLTQYGSVRGASSFGLTYPKIYLDGIELANPLLLTRLTPSSIERIEAIRGPQGAALYGADAISGVINVVTRNAGFDSANRGVGLASNLGVTSSEFSSGTVVRQQYTLDYQTGSNIRSFGLTVAGSESDEFFPDAYGRDLSALARFRAVREHLNINATARLFAQEAGNGISPLLIDAIPIPDTMTTSPFLRFHAEPQQVLQYTLGGTLTYAKNERWTHMLVAGLDGYELDNVANVSSPWPTPLDSALQAARGGATRITFRGSSTARVGNEEGNTGSFTIGLEHSQLRKDAPEDRFFGDPGLPPEYAQVVSWQSNTGLIGQFTGALGERWYLSTGLRIESNQALSGGSHLAGLPMFGVAYVNDFDFATMKVRAAYGRGIRAPQSGTRELAMRGGHRPPPNFAQLDAESQSGVEAGVDFWVGERASFQVTHFNQTASGLIQQVAVVSQPEPGRRGIHFIQQNVGEISNDGWELQASYKLSSLSLAANYSTVDSRVEQVAFGYTGDLQAGDRMLNVPARTFSFTALWDASDWSLSLTAARAYDWIGYDRLSLAAAYVDLDRPTSGFVGSELRAYWRNYNGVTWLRGSVSRDLTRRFTLSLIGDNLLNHQQGEPDDVTILPGRTVSASVRAKF